jgi:glycosyltransferase involved in cell wall biosynthesis
MKIGIDARFLTHPQRGGFKTYTCSLISALATASADLNGHRYILYTDRDADVPIDLPSNFELSPVTGAFPLREQVLLPLKMIADGIEVAHFPCNTAPVFYRRPMVVTIHDAIAMRNGDRGSLPLKGKALHAYWRLVIPRCAGTAGLVITDSRAAAGDLRVTLDVPPSRMRVVHLGIDPGFQAGSAPVVPCPGIEPDECFLLGFASADGRKNESRTISAFRLISRDFPSLKLVLVCTTPEIRSRIEESRLPAVLPLDSVPVEQLRWLYRNARALVFPSLDEGFGLPPLEAMASGTPVVSSRRGSLGEVLGDSAVFVDPTNETSIADGIRVVLDDQTNRRLRSAGLAHAEQFTLERMAEDTMRIYWEAVHGGKA